MTQFLAYPMYIGMPSITTAAGGRTGRGTGFSNRAPGLGLGGAPGAGRELAAETREVLRRAWQLLHGGNGGGGRACPW